MRPRQRTQTCVIQREQQQAPHNHVMSRTSSAEGRAAGLNCSMRSNRSSALASRPGKCVCMGWRGVGGRERMKRRARAEATKWRSCSEGRPVVVVVWLCGWVGGFEDVRHTDV